MLLFDTKIRSKLDCDTSVIIHELYLEKVIQVIVYIDDDG